MKNIAVILAGGIGKRMGDVNLPKQFLEIGGIPIIILTLKNFINSKLFHKFYIAINPDWKEYLQELLFNYNLNFEFIIMVNGGKERNDSIENSLDLIKENENIKDDDIIVIHDAVRPFITTKLLTDAINETQKFGATVAITPVKDTMILSEKGIAVSMPDRTKLFHGQAPDSFKFSIIYNALKSLTEDERKFITGTSQICASKNIPVHTFLGDERNIKITTIMDLFLANAIYKEMFS